MARKKRNFRVNQSKVFSVPAIVGQKRDISRALKVGRSQIAAANEQSKAMGCGEPFRADGCYEGTRAEKRRYIQELNLRRADHGEPPMVNFDGGYGDET